MRVRYLHAIGGHAVDDVDELRDRDALRLIDQGYVTEYTGDDTDTPTVDDGDVDTAITFGPEGRTTTVDPEARADRHSGKGTTLPDDVEPVHIDKDDESEDDEHSTEPGSENIDGLSLKELRSLAEARGVATYGTKDDLKTRIAGAENQSTQD